MAAKLKHRRWLCKKGSKNILVRLEIIKGKQKGILYEPGDHAIIFPVNTDEDIDFILKHITNLPTDSDSIVQLQRRTKKIFGKKV